MEEIILDGSDRSEYRPRPRWQVWVARVALVVMLIAIGLWLYHIAYPV